MSDADLDQRPGPGEEHNPGPPAPARQAATVILLRAGSDGPEVLLVKRNPAARFMGGVWVFPGGAVEDADGSAAAEDAASEGGYAPEGDGRNAAHEDDRAHRAAAIRELREEAAITLHDPAELVKFSRWITPAEVQIRFDTHFFLAELPAGQEPAVDGEECVDVGWFTPPAALLAHREQQIALVFPTIKHLEQLTPFTSVHELLAYARGRRVEPVQPRVVVRGEVARVLLPDEEGY
jgi:8-oxo-dGTP pyrophosphatase MutT (NUDIX family)